MKPFHVVVDVPLLLLLVSLLGVTTARVTVDSRLQAAIKRSNNVIAKYNQIAEQHNATYPGYFTFIRPQFETYNEESSMLRDCYQQWKKNASHPVENLMHCLPGMIFDTEENEKELARVFVVTAVARLETQAKSILAELDRITFLVTSAQPPNESIASLHNSSLHLYHKLRESITRLNYTLYLTSPNESVFEDFFQVIEDHLKISEQLTDLVDLQAQVGQYLNNLKEKKGQEEPAVLELENQRFNWFQLAVKKAVHAANKTFKEYVKDKSAMKEFRRFLRENGVSAQRIAVSV